MTSPEPTAKEWMSTTVASEALGVNLNRLYRLIDTEKIPAYGSADIRLRRVDVERARFVLDLERDAGSLRYEAR